MKILAGFLMFASLSVWAGNGEGNGGGAIVCADSNGEITSAKLLDLWEFEKKYPGTIERSEVSKEIQLGNAVARLSKYDLALSLKVDAILKTLDSKKVPLHPSQGILAPPSDTLIESLRTPRNCPLSGAALYDDKKDKLTIDEEVLAAMSQTDLAALDFHEALYKAQRSGIAKPTNSVSARFITGAIFSNLPSLPSYKDPYDGIENATYKCSSKGGDEAFIIPTAIGKYDIQVVSVLGERVFDKTVFEVSKDNTRGGDMLSRLAMGFAKWDRLASKQDMSGADLNPFVSSYTRSIYGPSLKLSLGASDTVAHKHCMGKTSCHVWAWTAQSRMFNVGATLQALTVNYDHRKGVYLHRLECTKL